VHRFVICSRARLLDAHRQIRTDTSFLEAELSISLASLTLVVKLLFALVLNDLPDLDIFEHFLVQCL
jgi:hypothetical protein